VGVVNQNEKKQKHKQLNVRFYSFPLNTRFHINISIDPDLKSEQPLKVVNNKYPDGRGVTALYY
jgi:hypothetical protein